MHRRLLLFLLCCMAWSPSSSRAEVLIDKAQSVAGPRSDAGTGACGTFIQYKRQGAPPMPPATRQDAEALLNRPATDTAFIAMRLSRLVERVNLRNGQTGVVEGDFTGAMYPDELFPYSQSPQASPMGTDVDIAMRLRGYFNVSSELAGKTLSFALNCDDFCALRIGQTDVVPGFNNTQSQRVIKQVRFAEAGLYPIELIYFQTAGAAYFEWAFADIAQPECTQFCTTRLTDTTLYGGKFAPVATSSLYSAVVDANPACQECGAPGLSCGSSSYCGDGLCQDCNQPDHCGPSCARCPSDARLCAVGKCVQCVLDADCDAGLVCEVGRCVPPTRCMGDEDCKYSDQRCDLKASLCRMPDQPCTTNEMCPRGQLCDGKRCYTPPTPCTTSAQCRESQYCDTAEKVCKSRLDARYVGAGCNLGARPSQGLAWVGLFGLALGGLLLRVRRRRIQAAG